MEKQARSNNYINLLGNWYQKVRVPFKAIVVDKKPIIDSFIPVNAILQKSASFDLSIPIEDRFFGSQQVASFNVKLSKKVESIEKILNKPKKSKKIFKAKFLNSFGAEGTTYEKEITMMETEAPDVQLNDKWEREPSLTISELPFNLMEDNLKIIPISLNFGDFTWGYILTPSLDAPVENAVIWFVRVHPRYENRRFYNLKSVLDTHWGMNEARYKSLCPA
ncbi:MAG: hypothetical protein LBS28_00320 [Streptococcaceae bacterium]|nr:hypothetical protein [Streptococcaceae bacterium]